MKRVPTDYTVVMCRLAREQGVDLLHDAGMTLAYLEGREFVPYETYLEIRARFAEVQRQSDWAFRLGQQLTMANHGPLGFGAVSAPTIRDGLAFMSRYIRTRASYLNCRIELPRGAIRIVIAHDALMLPFLRHSCETLAMIFQAYIESAGGTAAPTVWRFPYGEPPNRADYDKWLRGGCTFAAEELRLEVPASVGMVSSAFRNDTAYQSAAAQCEAMLHRASIDPLIDRVRGILSSHIERRAGEAYPVTAIPSADEVAAQLQISRRTLIRQLKAAGTSFQALKDELLATQMKRLIAQEGITMVEIANRLGYADAANFTRARRRMFGVTPRDLPKNG